MRSVASTTKLITLSLVAIYIVIPTILYLIPHIHVNAVFLHFVKWPFLDYSNPQQLGVKTCSRNFYLTVENGEVGVWQILPKDVTAGNAEEFEQLIADKKYPVIVYNHGNCWSRVAPHRMKLYNLLADAGYHVIAFDYRGFGDSPGYPTEEGMIKDATVVYEWTLRRAGGNSVFVWGHSLGTAITTAMAKDLCVRGECPHGVILECPFNNLKDAIRHHIFSLIFRWIPWKDAFLIDPPVAYGLQFNTDERIKDVRCPILIMHDHHDMIVPFHLGQKLQEAALKAGADVTFAEFHQHGHKYICNAPGLLAVINDFVKISLSKKSLPEISNTDGITLT